jgi:hypothetical protein
MRLPVTQRTAGLGAWLRVFVVLVFAFRALIPTGYMFAAVDGHSRLVICPAGLQYAPGKYSMAGMVHASGMDHGVHASLGADQCPFALAGGAAFLAAVCEPAEPNFVILQPASARATASVPIAPPSRYHAPRGPPFLA